MNNHSSKSSSVRTFNNQIPQPHPLLLILLFLIQSCNGFGFHSCSMTRSCIHNMKSPIIFRPRSHTRTKMNMNTDTKNLLDSKTAETKNNLISISRQRIGAKRQRSDSDESSSSIGGDSNIRQMKFIGTKRVTTKPITIPLSVSNEESDNNEKNISNTHTKEQNQRQQQQFINLMNEFFSNELHRNLLFPTNHVVTFDLNEIVDEELLNKWTEEAKLGGGEGPSMPSSSLLPSTNQNEEMKEEYSIFKIDALLQMPGLKIISESTIGMKLLLANNSNQSSTPSIFFPEYQFTLLESNLKPIGPAPLVWLFKKLTKYRDSTSSFTKVKIEKVANQIMFVTDARLETRMHLPSKLLRVLPSVNVDNFEKQGSEAVQKLLEKELEPALKGFCDAFCTLVEDRTCTNHEVNHYNIIVETR